MLYYVSMVARPPFGPLQTLWTAQWFHDILVDSVRGVVGVYLDHYVPIGCLTAGWLSERGCL